MTAAAAQTRSATLKTAKKRIADLTPADYNPNEMTDAQLRALSASMAKFDYVEPVVWNKRSKLIVGGHQRVRVLKAEGVDEVEVVVVDLDAGDERALNVALNTIRGEQEPTALADVLAGITEAQRTLAGWDEEAFNTLLASTRKHLEDGDSNPDAVPEQVASRVKAGDAWELGDHRLLCGDATSRSDVQSLLSDVRYDLMITDPPYGVDYSDKTEALASVRKGRARVPIQNDAMKPAEMYDFWLSAFTEARSFAAPGAAYYVSGPSGDNLFLLGQALSAAGFPLRHMLIWAKQHFVMGRCDYHYQHEPILYGWVKGRHRFYGGRTQSSLWEIDRPKASQEHPTMKPVELFERAITNSSRQGRIVFDPFAGSGTCIVAAERAGRRCFAIEIAPAYCDVILRRWEDYTGKQAKMVA